MNWARITVRDWVVEALSQALLANLVRAYELWNQSFTTSRRPGPFPLTRGTCTPWQIATGAQEPHKYNSPLKLQALKFELRLR